MNKAFLVEVKIHKSKKMYARQACVSFYNDGFNFKSFLLNETCIGNNDFKNVAYA